MRNVLAVAGKELRAYFHSPIAYLVMTVYALICGYVFYSSTAFFMVQTFRMEAMGGMGAPPMSLNENIIRPILAGVMTVVLLFLIPLITMRLYAEEKRSGTIELLLTSPLTDMEIILGKFLGALALFAVLEAITFIYFAVLFIYGNPNAKPLIGRRSGVSPLRSRLAGAGHVVLDLHEEPDYCRRRRTGGFPSALSARLGHGVLHRPGWPGDVLPGADHAF